MLTGESGRGVVVVMPGKMSARLAIVAAMVMAAYAGYWRGSMTAAVGSKGAERRVSERARDGGRAVVSRRSLTGEAFLREVMYGRLDKMQQWEIVRCFSEEEVKEALELRAALPLRVEPLNDLNSMLYQRWVELGPAVAFSEVWEKGDHSFMAIFPIATAWINQDPVGAWQALRDKEVGRGFVPWNDWLDDRVAESFAADDILTAFRKASALDDSIAACVVQSRIVKAAYATPESIEIFGAAMLDSAVHGGHALQDFYIEKLEAMDLSQQEKDSIRPLLLQKLKFPQP